jgi:hypothetical protein
VDKAIEQRLGLTEFALLLHDMGEVKLTGIMVGSDLAGLLAGSAGLGQVAAGQGFDGDHVRDIDHRMGSSLVETLIVKEPVPSFWSKARERRFP